MPGPLNAALIDLLRRQAVRPSPRNDLELGGWQLHTHPDLIERLDFLAPGERSVPVFGMPVLARSGVAAVVAMSMDILLLRLPRPPTGVEPGHPVPPLTDQGWYSVNAWQSDLPTPEGNRRLARLVRGALESAGPDIASRNSPT